MENKNLNDIVIEDADSSKKTQLKNILTLLALLFIILVISIVITKLILGSDEENSEPTMITTETNKSENDTLISAGAATVAGATAAATAVATNTLSSRNEATNTVVNRSSTTKAPLLAERNTSSRTKAPLREEPIKSNTGKKGSSSSESRPPKRVSTYTRPKYVVTKEPVKTRTKEPVKHVASASRGYYIKVGTFKDASTAIKNIKSIKLKYKTIQTKDGLTRVLIGPFYSHKDAQNHLAKAKAHVARDAYITKIK